MPSEINRVIAMTNIYTHPDNSAVKLNIKIGDVLNVTKSGYVNTYLAANDISGSCFIKIQSLIEREYVLAI